MTAPFPISLRRGCLRRKYLEQRREYLRCLIHLRDRLGFREVARRSPIRSAKVSGAMIVGVPPPIMDVVYLEAMIGLPRYQIDFTAQRRRIDGNRLVTASDGGVAAAIPTH